MARDCGPGGCVGLLAAFLGLCVITGLAEDECGGRGDGSCCAVAEEGVGGCGDTACCKLVCGIDQLCCDVWWDEYCVAQAVDLCGEDYCGPCQGSDEVFTVPVPYPNIASGVAAACDGDIVLVGPGVYQEQVFFEGKRVQLISEEGPEKTIIDAGLLSDENGDRFPDECAGSVCPGDIDGNGEVDGSDVTIILAFWLSEDPTADLDGNGVVDGQDLTIVLAYWGKCE